MAERRPNFLFLFSDEHSFRCLGCLPHERGGEPVDTPTLDQLILGGTYFSDAYCQMPLCTPSRLCALTGREVRGAGAWSNNSILRPELPTMASLLRTAGYGTALVGKMHLGGSVQFAGFEHRPYGDLTGQTGHQWEPLLGDGKSMRSRTTGAGLTGIPESLIQDQVVAAESIAWIREYAHAHADQPWFLCASFSRPHFPLTVPRRHFDRYWPDGVTEPRVPASGDAYDHPMSVGMRRGFQADAISHDEQQRARAAYFGCVSYLDEILGDMLLRLDKDNLLDETIIVYSTDHGELAGEHGVWWKNGWYEGCTRVPLIVSLPEQRRGKLPAHVCQTPVGLVDLLPTFCDFAGVDVPDGLDGVSLAAAVRTQASPPDRPIVCDALTPRWGPGTEFRMVRKGDYKYVCFRDAPPLLFNLARDPGEQHNLVDSTVDSDVSAHQELARFAEESMDFEAAEEERTVRDGPLATHYPLPAKGATGNLYLLPDGRLVNADDTFAAPTVITDDPASFFADYPGESR